MPAYEGGCQLGASLAWRLLNNSEAQALWDSETVRRQFHAPPRMHSNWLNYSRMELLLAAENVFVSHIS